MEERDRGNAPVRGEYYYERVGVGEGVGMGTKGEWVGLGWELRVRG